MTAVHFTSWSAPSSVYGAAKIAVMAPPLDGVGATVNGQITKMLVVVDSLRLPVALDRKSGLPAPVGSQAEPETVMY